MRTLSPRAQWPGLGARTFHGLLETVADEFVAVRAEDGVMGPARSTPDAPQGCQAVRGTAPAILARLKVDLHPVTLNEQILGRDR